MTSRVEELQRMCDNINENGGLDSGEWHTALLAQIAQNLAVIADVMMADRKTENCSEKPNNWEDFFREPTAEERKAVADYIDSISVPTGVNIFDLMDEPQAERIKTHDYCDICNHKRCENCIANNLDDYCVPSGYEPITKTETQNSNLTFEKADERCKGCNHYKLTCDLFSEICRFEPKDEPRTDRLVQTNVIELPDTHQKVVFERKITEEDDCIKIGEWKYKGFEEE